MGEHDSIDKFIAEIWEQDGINQRIEDYFNETTRAKALEELQTPDAYAELELLKDRFLCAGGILLVAGPTGIGKSSLVMQMSISWAVGKPCFGIVPARPLKTLIIQAENDEGDMCEQRDGVFKGLELPPEEKLAASKSVFVFHENALTAEALIARIQTLLTQNKVDILVLDPANAYIGGDNSAQKDVGRFLRNLLNPLLTEFKIGCIIAHHTNKPPKGKERETWKAGDFAYLGSGSSEWANVPRGVLAIRSIGSHTVYQLVAAKRGKRLGWRDEDGMPTYTKMIAHHDEPGTICWREAREDEIPQEDKGDGKKAKLPLEQKIANIWKSIDEKLSEKEFKERVKSLGGHRSLPTHWWKKGIDRGVFRLSEKTGEAGLTGKFKPMPSEFEQYERTSDRNFNDNGEPCDF